MPLFSDALKKDYSKEIFILFFNTTYVKYEEEKNFQHNPGSGTKLGQSSGSGPKFNIFGSTTLVNLMCRFLIPQNGLDTQINRNAYRREE